MPQLRRHSPTKLCDGAKMGIFLRRVFSASRVQHISDLHSKFAHLGHITRGSMVTSNTRPLRIGEEQKKERRR